MRDMNVLFGRVAIVATALFALSASAGIKYWDNPAFRAFDVDCYVPGAVWNYDGIRNQGATAAHDNAATTWVNLGSNVGFGGDAQLTSKTVGTGTAGEWADDGYIFRGKTRWYGAGKITVAGDFTVQMLVDADATAQLTTGLAPACSVMIDNFAFCIYNQNSFLFRLDGTYDGPKITAASKKYDYANVIRDNTNKKAYMFSGTEASDSGEGYREYSSAIASKSTTGYGLGSTSSSGQQFVGKLKFFRLYQGILSSEQLAWNRVVDERRYFPAHDVSLPVTNSVVVSSVAASAEPAGTYAVDGSHVFTAPRIATVGNAKYICTGYTLETWDDMIGDWGTAVFHARELSCKVEDADCVRITWKWMDGDGIKTYDVSDYVWDGLELFYDGICNVGTNAAHDATALTWKNLGSKGAVNDMFLQLLNADGTAWTTAASLAAVDGRDPGEWTAAGDGFALAGDSRWRVVKTGSTNGGINTSDGDYSLQTLLDVNATDQSGNVAYVFSLSQDAYSILVRKSGRFDWRSDSATGSSADGPLTMSGTSFDYATCIANKADNTLSLFSGTNFPSSGSGFRQLSSITGHEENGYDLAGYGNTNYDALLIGILKFFRQYDHALTPEEVAKNRKVDDFRYFGKFAEADVAVQSTHPALRGNEPDGEYDLDGSHVFSAPATATIKVNGKEIEYACDGYTLETWDGSAWGDVQRGNAYAVEIAEGSAKKRLTWLWRPVRGLRTAADYSFDDLSQAGLVWNYDGIRNQGGTDADHSLDATTWKNLGTAAGADLGWDGKTPTGGWTENGYRFANGPRFKGGASFGPLKNFTLQTLVDADIASQPAGNQYSTIFSGNYQWFNLYLVAESQTQSAGGSLCWRAQNDAKYMYFKTKGHRYDYATAIMDFDNATAKLFPGVDVPATPASPTPEGSDNDYNAYGEKQRSVYRFASVSVKAAESGYGIGRRGNESAWGMNGTVKFLRYYDRVLTEEEIIRNRNADAVRYFGALGVTNVLVTTKYSNVEGDAEELTEAPGAYTVEGSWTFSATRVKDRLGALKDVAGYYTEELDALGNWTNKTWHEGKTAYTYDATSPACVRLTWSVMPPGLILIVR